MLERWKKKRAELGFGPEAVTNEPRKESESPLAEELPPVDLEPHGIVTRSPKLQEYAAWLGRVAPTRLPILIRGESGTGKELFARMVHNLSDRADGPYISVNCAALPRDIIESELFGHRRGAFTGATEEKSGLFLAAHKGTIFLDEIGEMSSLLQAKLLRVLEDGEVRRLGDTHTRRVDVRIVAATNVAIEKAVQNGSFRKDLYYRLRGMEVFLPSLRERLEDVVPLAQRFVEEACARFGKRVTLPIGTATWLMGRHWDGNVRELRNAVEQAVAICGNGKEILPYHFGTATAPEASAPSLTDDLDAIEASRIRNALDAAKWNKTEAAKLLGVSRTTLNGKMNRLEIRPPKKH
jgi:transcriptional regulator with PAS, ATPase and Fis domain